MPCLLFLKMRQNLKCRLLQIIGGTLWVNQPNDKKDNTTMHANGTLYDKHTKAGSTDK